MLSRFMNNFHEIIKKSIIKDGQHFLLKYNLKQILAFGFFDILRTSKYYLFNFIEDEKLFKKTRQYFNKFSNCEAFVFGGGSSLKIINFEKVKRYQKEENMKVFCVSSYLLSDEANIVTPDFYLLSDPAFFGEKTKISVERSKEIEATIKKINDNNIVCFVPAQYGKNNKILNSVYFNDFENRWGKNVVDITKPRCYLSMTAYKALSVACYLGFKKIYICGIDNDWFKYIQVDSENSIYYLNPHFFNQADSELHKVPKQEAENLGELLYHHSFLFLDLYKFPKNKIINLDKESLIDAFSKKHNLDIYKK